MSAWTLCIDFGTAFSKAAAAPSDLRFDPANVRPLQLNPQPSGNPFLLDSAVFVDDARILFGRSALDRASSMAGRKRVALQSFKTLLSAADLERALDIKAPLSIDPHRAFCMRDLIVLYLAYLLAAIERARAADACIPARINLRYAAPAWQGGDSDALHAVVAGLFGEAEALRMRLGDALLADEGIDLALAATALPRAADEARPRAMGLIHEAAAAAAYTSIGLDESGSHLIVVDMGAGTTDMAVLMRADNQMHELADARVTFNQAGDFLDRLIADRALKSASWAKSTAQKTALWGDLMRAMPDLKAAMFAEGRASRRYERRLINVSLRDIERDQDFKAFLKELQAAYAHCVAVARGDALLRENASIEAVAVGGGAGAPFIQELISGATKRGPRVTPRPATPGWAHSEVFGGNLAPVFPQLAIAIGGALAPDNMLAAGGAA